MSLKEKQWKVKEETENSRKTQIKGKDWVEKAEGNDPAVSTK